MLILQVRKEAVPNIPELVLSARPWCLWELACLAQIQCFPV